MSLRDLKGTLRDALPLLRRRKSRPLLQQSATASPAGPTDGTRHRSFGSILSFADSFKANVASRTGSVRVTRRERKTVRAQDIFLHDPACGSTSNLQHDDAEKRESRRTHTPDPVDDCGRSSTPLTPVVLKKALLPISASAPAVAHNDNDNANDNDQGGGERQRAPSTETDASVPEFEGYLDILSYLQRDLPKKPSKRSISMPSPAPGQASLKAPKEEEWMSCRSPSQSSRGRLSRSNSNTDTTAKTVTPMSSVDLDSEVRPLYTKQSVPTLAESRIEEVSEPEPELTAAVGAAAAENAMKTPKRSRSAPPKCFHCGRDPGGPDPEYTNSSFVTVLKAFELDEEERKRTSAFLDEEVDGKQKEEEEKALTTKSGASKRAGPSVPVKDSQGRCYLLYPQTSFYERIGEGSEAPQEPQDANASRTHDDDFFDGLDDQDDLERRLSQPDDLCRKALETARRDIIYALGEAQNESKFWADEDEDHMDEDHEEPGDSNACTPTAARHDPYERPFNPDPYSCLDSPLFPEILEHHDHYHDYHDYEHEQILDEEDGREREYQEEDERESESPRPTFWKDPNAVIVVYKGIEVDGKQVYYGADINYLGSFYDEDEDSSGLESSSPAHHSPSSSFGTMTPTGLCMIPEVSFSDEFSEEGEDFC